MNPRGLNLAPELVQVIEELGFTRLTPIQAQSIPPLLEGRDLIGQSKTGSGKTAAFCLPILQKIDLTRKKIQALILCPTRELCMQVAREARRFGRRLPGLQVLLLSGGQPVHPQLKALKKGIHIVVGTPGRLLDHLRRGSIHLDDLSFVVLDEADRMLDMGFRPDMEAILGQLPPSRQTVFFSATYPATIQAMSRAFQRDPVRVTIEDAGSPHADIEQLFYEVKPEAKLGALRGVLTRLNPESALIFCNLKATVNEVGEALTKAGLSSAPLHGDMEQADRERIMAKFRNGSTRFLVATDVAARGLDVSGLDMVVNYDLPAQTDSYVHRIGRTGRAGQKGRAVSLLAAREKFKLKNIERATGVRGALQTLADTEQVTQEQGLQAAKMKTLYISGGRKEKMRPGDILGALTGEAGGLAGSEIGKIEIHDHFSYVAVSSHLAQTALQRLRAGRIKGRKFKVEMVR